MRASVGDLVLREADCGDDLVRDYDYAEDFDFDLDAVDMVLVDAMLGLFFILSHEEGCHVEVIDAAPAVVGAVLAPHAVDSF